MQIGKAALLKQIQYSHINYNHKKEWFIGNTGRILFIKEVILWNMQID